MSYIRHKMIAGHRYAYEVSAYWDAQLKKPRQKVKYLGAVNDAGAVVKKSEQIREEKLILDFGDTYLLYEHLKQLPFYQVIQKVFASSYHELLPLVFYRLCHKGAMMQAQTWFEGNIARVLFKNAELASQRISEFLRRLGDENVQRKFFKVYLSSLGSAPKGIIIDATSLPNQIQVGFNAWGYSDGAIDKQMRFLCVIDQHTLLPLFFRYLPGNLLDVSTLKLTLEELHKLGVKESFMLMDAGYFSEENLSELYENKISFLTRLPAGRKIYQELIEQHISDLERVKYAIRYGQRGLFIKEVKIQLYGHPAYAYIVLDPERKGREVSKLLLECLGEDEESKEAQERLKSRGIMVLMASFPIASKDLIPSYYLRQTVEHVFGFCKDDLKIVPLRSHTEETLKGYLFLIFIALIFFLECRKRLGEKNKYTIEHALMIMRNLKCKVFDNELLTQELSKQQKEITQLFNIIVPKKSGV